MSLCQHCLHWMYTNEYLNEGAVVIWLFAVERSHGAVAVFRSEDHACRFVTGSGPEVQPASRLPSTRPPPALALQRLPSTTHRRDRLSIFLCFSFSQEPTARPTHTRTCKYLHILSCRVLRRNLSAFLLPVPAISTACIAIYTLSTTRRGSKCLLARHRRLERDIA